MQDMVSVDGCVEVDSFVQVAFVVTSDTEVWELGLWEPSAWFFVSSSGIVWEIVLTLGRSDGCSVDGRTSRTDLLVRVALELHQYKSCFFFLSAFQTFLGSFRLKSCNTAMFYWFTFREV